MPGGPSQVDTFDYKQPNLLKNAGERPQLVDRKSLRNTKMGLMPSPYTFKQYGQSGKWVSEIFPYTAQLVDDLCFIHSMHTDIPEHAGAMMMMNAGHLQTQSAEYGILVGLRAWYRKRKPAGLHFDEPRAQPRNKLANWGNAVPTGGLHWNLCQYSLDEAGSNRF